VASTGEFNLSGWHVDPRTGEISRDGKAMKLEPKVMDLLLYMSRRPGEALTREEILEGVWKDVVVGYDALTGAVIKLRKAFDDDARNPRIIETLPKKGYRLIGELSSHTAAADTAGNRLERKLAAILYADVADYSRLTEDDEEGTHQILSAYLDTMSQAIAHHNGKVIHYAGDAVLADFPTVIDALGCAVDIQRDLAARNARQAADRVVQFRLGLNLGDVIVDRDDIYGEGVNVAARLESLADPGGICISESVRSTVGHKLPLTYEFLGEQTVKNIAEPIRAYRVLAGPPATAVGSPRRRLLPLAAGAGALAVAVVFGLWSLRDQPGTVEAPAPAEELATADELALPDKPSIAVMPFVNNGNNREDEYFSDGITDDLITDLSNISGLFVISRNSTFRYKGQAVDVRTVARALGVRYVLEGSVRRSGNRVRINSQLVDGATGGQLWASRYDGSLENVFDLQDQVTSQIISALALQLTESDESRRKVFETSNVAAYDEFLRGWEQYRNFTRESFRRAELHFRQALELDPNYSRAHAALALLYWKAALKRWHQNQSSTMAGWVQARREIEKSMSNPTSLAHSLLSAMNLYNRRYAEAIAEARRAIALNANIPDGYLALADALIYSGRPQEAIEAANTAIRLDPNYAAPYLSSLGLAHFDLRNYSQAADVLQRSIAINPQDQTPYLILLATYGQLGQQQQARTVLERVNQLFQQEYGHDYRPDLLRGQFPYQDRAAREHLLQGLQKGGAPQS
jgi:TolB-like protein/class 3 adenylate cyclase